MRTSLRPLVSLLACLSTLSSASAVLAQNPPAPFPAPAPTPAPAATPGPAAPFPAPAPAAPPAATTTAAPAPGAPAAPAPGATAAPAAGAPAADASGAASASWGFGSSGGSASGSSSSSGFGAGAAAATASPDALKLRRDAGLHEMLTLSGSTGVLRVASAEGAPVGTFRVQALYEYFSSSGFLCNGASTCPPTAGDDKVTRFGATFGASASVASWLEVYGSMRSYATSNDRGKPELLQALGDTTLGVKVMAPRDPFSMWYFGGDLQALLMNGTGGVGLNGDSTSFRLRGNVTADFRKPQAGIPLLAHLNLGYRFDNSGKLIADTETSRGRPISRIERFGLGINRTDAVEVGLALEAPIEGGKVIRWVRPFAEYTIDLPVNRQNYICNPSTTYSGDFCLGNQSKFKAFPSRATLGVRANPFLKGVVLTAAVDIGVTGKKTFLEETSPQAPWTMWLGVGFGYDTVEPPPVIQEKLVEKPVATGTPQFLVSGNVHEINKSDGIPNAVIKFEGRDLTGLVTDSQGRFLSGNMEPGQYTFTVTADGYKPGTCTVVSVDQPTPPSMTTVAKVDCAVEALPRLGTVSGKVQSDGNGVGGATVTVTDATGKQSTVTSDAGGNFRVENVPPGTARFRVQSKDYLGTQGQADVKAREEAKVTLSLTKRPKKANVVVGAREIAIRQQVHFATDSAVIQPDSAQLLEEIADVMIQTPRIKLVEIQGHTDSNGSAASNRLLSEQRANAVRDRLIAAGVAANRLQAKGYGAERPLVPNITAANRARNRRVVLQILEQDKK
jgi:OmpA-OmpF porin, OOP family